MKGAPPQRGALRRCGDGHGPFHLACSYRARAIRPRHRMDGAMLYVIRNESGQVAGISESFQAGAESLPNDAPEILAFLARLGGSGFLASDLALIRVIEDVVEVMIRKNLLTLTDLPGAAQDKLVGRRALRGWLAGLAGLHDGDGGKVI